MENAWSDTSNDGVSLHWFPKDLNLRKMLTSKVKIKRGQLDRSQRLQRYATVKKRPRTTGPGQRQEGSWRSGTEWSHFVTEMHVNASGRDRMRDYHFNTYYAELWGQIYRFSRSIHSSLIDKLYILLYSTEETRKKYNFWILLLSQHWWSVSSTLA